MANVENIVKETLSVLSKIVNQDLQENGENVSEADQEIALDCFVKLFAKVKLSDHMGILSFAVGLLTIRPTGESLRIQCKICETLCRLILGNEAGIKGKYGKWKEIITNELVNESINIFKAVETMLLMQALDDNITNQKIVSCVNVITTMLDSNPYVKKSFDESFGMKKLCNDIKLHNNLRKEVADSLLKLLTISNNKNVEIGQRVITLPKLATIIIEIVPHFDDLGQRTICETVRVMCASRLQNRLICCHAKLISEVLLLFDEHGDKLAESIKDCLISIMEILGCLSISAAELKLLIMLFQKKNGESQVLQWSK